jgi:hypothetical protein
VTGDVRQPLIAAKITNCEYFPARYSNLAPPARRDFVLPRDGAGILAKDLGFFAGSFAYARFKIAKLKSMAGKVTWESIAAELARSPGALAVKACELGLLAAL